MTGFVYRFLRWCPGALGLILRQKMYPRLFASCGKGLLCGRFVDIHHPDRIYLGKNVILHDYAKLGVNSVPAGENALVLEDDVFIGVGTCLEAEEEKITIKSGANIGSYCRVTARNAPVTIGTSTLLAAYCRVGGSIGSQKMVVEKGRDQIFATFIGAGCWLGVRSELVAGFSIGDGCIVGAHAVVRSDMESNVIVVGRPAGKLRERIGV